MAGFGKPGKAIIQAGTQRALSSPLLLETLPEQFFTVTWKVSAAGFNTLCSHHIMQKLILLSG